MPKGIYSRDGEFRGTWTFEQDEWLEARCKTNASYRAIARDFNEAFPHDKKTRSAIMGRASRRGFADHKPHHKVTKRVRVAKPKPSRPDRPVNVRGKVKPAQELAPVVFKDQGEVVLRGEGPLVASRSRLPGRRASAQEIATRLQGHLPSIVETAPLTSVLLSDCPDNGCRWPTSDNDQEFRVCGAPAKIGSYCERHGGVAFREMPTVARNRNYSKRGMLEGPRKQLLDADAQALADALMEDELNKAPGLAPEVETMVLGILKDEQ